MNDNGEWDPDFWNNLDLALPGNSELARRSDSHFHVPGLHNLDILQPITEAVGEPLSLHAASTSRIINNDFNISYDGLMIGSAPSLTQTPLTYALPNVHFLPPTAPVASQSNTPGTERGPFSTPGTSGTWFSGYDQGPITNGEFSVVQSSNAYYPQMVTASHIPRGIDLDARRIEASHRETMSVGGLQHSGTQQAGERPETMAAVVSPDELNPFRHEYQDPLQMLPDGSHESVISERIQLMPDNNALNVVCGALPSDMTASVVGKGATEQFRCTFVGCTSKVVFKRIYDLNRHMLIHKGDRPYSCIATGCKMSFYRWDKLRSHIRSHGEDAGFNCFYVNCPVSDIPLASLGVHVTSAHCGRFYTGSSQWVWQELFRSRICSLAGCRTIMRGTDPFRPRKDLKLDQDQLQEHLKSKHNERDRFAQKTSLADLGYDHSTCNLICPVCNIKFLNAREIHSHLLMTHIADEAHLKAWFQAVLLKTYRKSTETLDAVIIDELMMYNRVRLPGGQQLKCPRCPFSIENTSKWTVQVSFLSTEHQDLLLESDSLCLHRNAIVKLLPCFGIHPSFDDLKMSTKWNLDP